MPMENRRLVFVLRFLPMTSTSNFEPNFSQNPFLRMYNVHRSPKILFVSLPVSGYYFCQPVFIGKYFTNIHLVFNVLILLFSSFSFLNYSPEPLVHQLMGDCKIFIPDNIKYMYMCKCDLCRCKFCNANFTTSGELVRHVRYKHTHEKPHRVGL